jgi:2-(1,2-epoxy-1,2-dihydrophenyl)acetyl-CoA isomerase
MMNDSGILFSCEDGIARITLNRPERLNSFTDAMHEALFAALCSVETDPTLRVVLLTGAGRGFCAGQDQSERKPDPGGKPRDLGEGLERYYKPLVLKLRSLPVPVVCQLNGVAAGAGASLALACDIVIAARSAYFMQAFGKLGLLPDAGATYFLPRLVGTARAMGLALLGDRLDAAQAAQWGLIWRCVEDADLAAETGAVVDRLAKSATRAMGASKLAIHAAAQHTLAEQLDLEIGAQRALGHTDDYREGAAAFREKRAPQFKGR